MAQTEKIPDKMMAVAIADARRPAGAEAGKAAVPGPGPGEILIKVRAAGVNRPDVAQRWENIRRRPAHPTCPAWRSRVSSSRLAKARRAGKSATRSAR
jgi:hypothetical protein